MKFPRATALRTTLQDRLGSRRASGTGGRHPAGGDGERLSPGSDPARPRLTGPTSSNWAGTASWSPAQHASPRDEQELAELITSTAARGGSMRPLGSGHSFSPIASTQDVQLTLEHFSGLVSVDHQNHRAVFRAGTPLHEAAALLAEQGLALQNMGDIDRQTLAGAISTGTHGTGLELTGFAGTVVSFDLMLADGTLVHADAQQEPELFSAARVGQGAFGVLTQVELQCTPAYRLRSEETLEPVEEVVESFLERSATREHLEFFWFPYSPQAVVKTLDHLPLEGEIVRPPAPVRYLSEELLGNTAYAGICRTGHRVPALQPLLNRVSTWGMPGPSVTDHWHRVYVSARRVRFREMEYALPLERFGEAMAGLRQILDRLRAQGHVIGFPVEVRTAAADDAWLSTAFGGPRVYIAVHAFFPQDHRPYFQPVEELFASLGGRPHWGKMHTLNAGQLAERYPQFSQAQQVLQRVDPQGVFSSDWIRRTLGHPGQR